MDRQERMDRLADDARQIGSEAYADGIVEGMRLGVDNTVRDDYRGFTFWQIFAIGFAASAAFRVTTQSLFAWMGWS